VINTGGEKVYAREVEVALLTHPAVTDAVVLGLPHHTLGQMVVAAVQLATGTVLDVDDLAVHLRQTLAGYKIPKEFHVLGSVERGDNGKIDLRALTRRLAELSAASSTATPASERPR
jgi:acyl-CoA synthetase (AMP-forming)/AMP-acid ligase II